jgi:hypothetical protein
MRPATATCNAVNRNGGYCELVAGFGTNHVGEGRCKFHGGASPGRPITHGLYSKRYNKTLAETTEELRAHPELLNLSAELLSLKAMIGNIFGALPEEPRDWLKDENLPKVRILIQLSAEIRKTFKALIEAQLKAGAFLTMADVTSMMRQIGFILDDVCAACPKRTVLQDRIVTDLRFSGTARDDIVEAQFEDVSGRTAGAEKREVDRARRRKREARARKKGIEERRERHERLKPIRPLED